MTSADRWSILIGVLGAVINAALLVVVYRQVRDATIANRADHDRRKKTATIEFYATTLEMRDKLRTKLPYDRDAEAVAALISGIKNDDDELGKSVTEYLSLFELLASGANADVFDRETIETMAGGRVRAIASSYRPWIQQRRARFNSPFLYEQIEQLAAGFEKNLPNRLRQHQERLPSLAAEAPPATPDTPGLRLQGDPRPAARESA